MRKWDEMNRAAIDRSGEVKINPKSSVKLYDIKLPEKIATNWFDIIWGADGQITLVWADPDDLIEDSGVGENSE